MSTDDKTLVIFRRWRNGHRSILALFPLELGTNDPATCSSYEHIGQHGSADPLRCIGATMPATPSEYKELRLELQRAGYELRIGKRIPRNAYTIRKAKLQSIGGSNG